MINRSYAYNQMENIDQGNQLESAHVNIENRHKGGEEGRN
jgi:hypothetical protein